MPDRSSTRKAPRRKDAAALVVEHLGLVERLARRLARRFPRSVDLDDLVSSGNEGLIDAARRFDPSRGVSFESYAEFRVRGAMIDGVREMDQLSRDSRIVATEIERAEGRVGTDPADVALELGISEEELAARYAKTTGNVVVSLSRRGAVRAADAAASSAPVGIDRIAAEEVRRKLDRAVRRLRVREQYVIALYYREELTMKQIAAIMGVTESRICQILASAAANLRRSLDPSLAEDAP